MRGIVVALSMSLMTQAVAEERGSTTEPAYPLSTLERTAVLEGVKSIFELENYRRSAVLGHAMAAARKDSDIENVCGFVGAVRADGKHTGDFPFIGYFVPSAAAFVGKTFVPTRMSSESTAGEIIAVCETAGIPMK